MPEVTASQRIIADANELSTKLYAVVQAHSPPTDQAIGSALAALAHVTALVLNTNPEAVTASLAMFIAVLGQEIISADSQEPRETTH